MIKIDSIVMGPLENNVYIVRCEGEQCEGKQTFTFVVDPTGKVPKIMDALESDKGASGANGDSAQCKVSGTFGGADENKCSILDAIICTHFHTDHTGGLAQLVRETGARVYAGEQDAPHIEVPRGARDEAMHLHEACNVDVRVVDGDVLHAGVVTWRFLHTPGHSAGGICLYKPAIIDNANTDTVKNEKYDVIINGKNYGNIPVLISGDTLFAGTTGRTDFFSSSDVDMQKSIKKLAKLPDETLVLPGHNEFSTIGAERQTTFCRLRVK